MSLQVNGACVGRAGDEVDELRVPRIAHVEDRESVAEGLADIGMASLDDDLDAVAAASLIRMAHELDIARCAGRHRDAPHSLRVGLAIGRGAVRVARWARGSAGRDSASRASGPSNATLPSAAPAPSPRSAGPS